MTSANKYNDGCIKIFRFLKLLYEDDAEYDKVIEIFRDELKNKSSNHIQVVINKYLNTLKVFGIKVVKEGTKFKLKSSIYSVQLSSEDIKSLKIIMTLSNSFPDEEISQNLKSLLEKIKLRMNNSDKIALNNIGSKYDFSFYYSGIREQIDYCKELCKNKCVIEIVYLKNKKEEIIKGTPKELIYDSRNVYLKIYVASLRQKIDIPLDAIISTNIKPQVASSIEIPSTVVYKLKSRLAKTYKVKENEYIDGFDKDGNLIVINKDEPHDKLLARLIRYTDCCEIISPKTLREEMLNLIDEMIDSYDD